MTGWEEFEAYWREVAQCCGEVLLPGHHGWVRMSDRKLFCDWCAERARR